MPEGKGKSTKTLKYEDIKSIAEVVRTLLREELDASLDRVANKIDAMQSELATVTTRITSAEGELDALKNSTKKDSTVLSTVQEKMLGFEQKIADLEDRNRRCNIRVYGLREDAEGDAPVQFLERMIPTWFPALKQLKPEIERAHRIFRGGPPTEGERPRAFIFCCLRFSTRQAILREARKHPLQSATEIFRFLEKRPSPGRLVDVAPAELGEEQAAPMTISPDHSDPRVGNE
ncbi:LINE-1 type transposase domain containing protein 1 [Dissostichus eleginoides]|uniref:LINE-1 type transposase domain containing protein 1 n=1 Tax=Dissostichus eleginoides TaxID=100907 RepID=A0AAD9CTU2_DISEL|nr:LINE-1 type transposase domain containing protein 1 [Dissostichus eleginoides]